MRRSGTSPALTSDHPFSFHDVLDPRLMQLGFAVVFVCAMGLLALGGSPVDVTSLLGAATCLALVNTARRLMLPW